MTLKTFLALSLLCFSFQLAAQAPDKLRVEHLGNKTDATITDVNDILEDKHGFIWMAGSNGLARYDGYNFKFYRNEVDYLTSINSSFTRGILEDSRGDLWVITFEGLNLYSRELDNFTHFPMLTSPKF